MILFRGGGRAARAYLPLGLTPQSIPNINWHTPHKVRCLMFVPITISTFVGSTYIRVFQWLQTVEDKPLPWQTVFEGRKRWDVESEGVQEKPRLYKGDPTFPSKLCLSKKGPESQDQEMQLRWYFFRLHRQEVKKSLKKKWVSTSSGTSGCRLDVWLDQKAPVVEKRDVLLCEALLRVYEGESIPWALGYLFDPFLGMKATTLGTVDVLKIFLGVHRGFDPQLLDIAS